MFGGGGGDADLSGTLIVAPNEEVTPGTLLTVYYYGGTEPVRTYQWKRGGANVGTNSNTYTPDQAGAYTVTVGAAGYKSKTSAEVIVNAPAGNETDFSGTLTVTPTIDVKIDTPLAAAYSGTEGVTYKWKKDGVTVGTNSSAYTPVEEGLYTVTISAAGFRSKTSAAVNVTAAAGNSDQKSIYVIGITQEYLDRSSNDAICGIFPPGTNKDDAMADFTAYAEKKPTRYVVAGLEFSSPVRLGSAWASSGKLYNVNGLTRWTGSGTVDMYALLDDGTKAYLYKCANILIQSAETTVSLFDLDVAYLGEQDLPQEAAVSGTISLTDIPANPTPKIWINVSGSKERENEGDPWYHWHSDSHGGNGVNISAGYTDLPWKIKISDFVWGRSPPNAEETNFAPTDLYFSIYVEYGSYDGRNYNVQVPGSTHINTLEEAVNIKLGPVSLNKPDQP